jgi:hypothetical protein
MTLTEFLLARIAEDEVVANQAVGYESRVYWDSAARDLHLRAQSLAHYMRHDPARVLAECEAKRRIVTEISEAVEWDDSCGDGISTTSAAARRALRHLAAIYADHAGKVVER